MDDITTIGIDLAKSVFQLHGVDAVGELGIVVPKGIHSEADQKPIR